MLFRSAGLFCDIYLTCEDARTAMTMAEKGLGIALLPASMLPLSHQMCIRDRAEDGMDVERIARLIKVSEDDVRKWIDEKFCVVK